MGRGPDDVIAQRAIRSADRASFWGMTGIAFSRTTTPQPRAPMMGA
jgi:hypothetical protein